MRIEEGSRYKLYPMNKSEKSIHNICIASIRRSIVKPYDFKWTRFYDLNSDFKISYQNISIDLSDDELIICSTIIDADNFSILTTRRLITNENGNLNFGDLVGATDKLYRDFKGNQSSLFTFGLIQLPNGKDLKYFIEDGKAAIVMIYGVKTIINLRS